MSALAGKSIVQLRSIAQGYGVKDIFSLDEAKLRQAIEMKQVELQPAPVVVVPKPEYDARLMTKPPSKKSERDEAMKMLKPYIDRGLSVRFTDEQWHMTFGKKTDQGTIRMPLRTLLRCAEKMFEVSGG
jgi:hypothetical protein